MILLLHHTRGLGIGPKKAAVSLLAAALALFLLPSAAAAQPTPDDESGGQPGGPSNKRERVVWIFTGEAATSTNRAELRRHLKASLDGKKGTHVFGTEGLAKHIPKTSSAPPKCLKGLTECASPSTLVFDQLDITLAIRVELEESESGLQARYELVDRSGEVSRTNTLDEESTRELALALAGDIFDATGTITVRTEPEGAQVSIDGQQVGTTPLTYRLPTGEHQYLVALADYREASGTIDVSADEPTVIEHELDHLEGTLLVEGAPASATVSLDGQEYGRAGEKISVEPGTYTLEVRAEDYETYRTDVEIGAGDHLEESVDMKKEAVFLDEVGPEAISVNSYITRLTYDHSFHVTSFRDARGESAGTSFEFLGFARVDGSPARQGDRRRFVDPNGARLDFTYSWKHFGIVLLSASYLATSLDLPAHLRSSDTDDDVPVTVTGTKRLQLRPIQLRYRYLYQNIAPFLELGTGITLQWTSVEGDLLEDALTVYNSEAFWTLGLGAEYFITPNIFASARYSAQFYFDSGLGAEHVLSFGAGVALPNLFGFEPEPPETL